MDNVHTGSHLLTPNCFMAYVDLQYAYYTISIDLLFGKYLRFRWQGQLWQYTARLYTKVLKPILASLRETGHIIVAYLDYIKLIGETAQQVESAVTATTQIFSELGFKILPQKSVLKPTQIIQFLGFSIKIKK